MKTPKPETKPAETPAVKPPEMPEPGIASASTMPDVNALSLLATQPRFNGHNDKEAVRLALALWREAKSQLDHEREIAVRHYEHYLAPLQRIKLPKSWPASFADFLRLVVGGKDEGEQLNRFRRYLLKNIRFENAFRDGTTTEPEGPASEAELNVIEQQISGFKAGPIPRFVWEGHALYFDRWWAVEKLEAKRRGGKARAAKSREMKKVATPA